MHAPQDELLCLQNEFRFTLPVHLDLTEKDRKIKEIGK